MGKEILVGLTGYAGSGKDTVANFMVKYGGYNTYALAGPLKKVIATMLGVPDSQWDDREWKEKEVAWLGRSPRYMAQTLGTEWGRQLVDSELWVKLMLRQWATIRRGGNARMVVTDVRFDNEAVNILDVGGTVWKVVRESRTPVEKHVSEAGVSPELITGKIMNNGTIAELETRIQSWLPFLLRRYGR